VTHQVIDVEKLQSMGYKFDANGDIVATPGGERVLRAASIAGMAKADKSAGAQSGTEGYVREIKTPAQYQTISRQVVDQPAAVHTIEVPATYKSVKTRVVDTPATTEEVVTPAVFETTTREVIDRTRARVKFLFPRCTGRSNARWLIKPPAPARSRFLRCMKPSNVA
jgi:hypothetical protein